MKPRYTDGRQKYKTAAQSREPGYLAKRMKAYARLQRLRAARQLTQPVPIKQRKVA